MFIKVAALKLSYVTSYCDCNMLWKMAALLVSLARRRNGKEDVSYKNKQKFSFMSCRPLLLSKSEHVLSYFLEYNFEVQNSASGFSDDRNCLPLQFSVKHL